MHTILHSFMFLNNLDVLCSRTLSTIDRVSIIKKGRENSSPASKMFFISQAAWKQKETSNEVLMNCFLIQVSVPVSLGHFVQWFTHSVPLFTTLSCFIIENESRGFFGSSHRQSSETLFQKQFLNSIGLRSILWKENKNRTPQEKRTLCIKNLL